MRVKLVPPPPDELETVAEAHRAVPLVPRTEEECWPAIADRLAIERRDVARTWLTFLRGLGLVRRRHGGFARTRIEPDRGTIATGLRAGVFPAEEVLDALESEPRSVDESFEHVVDTVPLWERRRDRNWRGTWRKRTEYLLEWFVVVGLADRRDGGYVRS